MTERILIVTEPDDTPLQGIRILHVDLSEEQRSIVSTSLLQSTALHNIINYVWNTGESVSWLLDKITKSDLIIFNANSSNELVIGWTAACYKSYYFGMLKELHIANDRAIYDVNDILALLEKVISRYEQV